MRFRILFIILFTSMFAKAQVASIYPLPRDSNNYPIPTNLGTPVFAEPTLTTGSYVSMLTLPTTGVNYGRQFQSICAYNPSSTRTVYICLGTGGCSTDMMKLPAQTGLCLDKLYFGYQNNITDVYGKLDTTGSVAVALTVW